MKTTQPVITFDGTYKRVRLNPAAVAKIPAGTNIKSGKLTIEKPGNNLEIELQRTTFGTTITNEPNGGQVFRNADLFDAILTPMGVVAKGAKARFLIKEVTNTPGAESGDFVFELEQLTDR